MFLQPGISNTVLRVLRRESVIKQLKDNVSTERRNRFRVTLLSEISP